MWKFFAVALVVLVSTLVVLQNAAAATPDPAVLVGTWKGEVEAWGRWPIGKEKGRILIIESVKQSGSNEWATKAVYGTVGEELTGVGLKLQVGDKVSISFVTPSPTSIALVLSSTPPWELAGTYSNPRAAAVYDLRLRKVGEKTAETVKR